MPAGSKNDAAVGAVSFLDPLDCFDHGFGSKHHAGAAAEWAVVHGAVAVTGEVAEVHDLNLDQLSLDRQTQHTDGEVGLDGLRKEG